MSQQVRRDTIKTVNFRGKLVEDTDQTIVRPFVKLDTIGSYIDENNHRQLVIVSNGDTFAVRMYVPKQIDTAQVNADIRTLQLMERIESIKPCDSSLLMTSDATTALDVVGRFETHCTPPEKPNFDVGFDTGLFVLMVPFTTLLFVKACLASVEMVGKIRNVLNS